MSIFPEAQRFSNNSRLEERFNLSKYGVRTCGSVNFLGKVEFVVMFNDGHGGIHVGVESFLQSVQVVVRAT